MGLLEKASNLEADEKEPETKVIKPKKEAPKETPCLLYTSPSPRDRG